MKVVFPCKGSLVLLKQDLETLEAFYNSSILTSKMLDIYKTSNVIVQVGNFNYVPQKSNLKLYNTTSKQTSNSISSTNNVTSQQDNTAPISDNDLLSNPFFQTLKPLN